MLSVLLGSAFLATRQFWGWLADRVGGVQTLLETRWCRRRLTGLS